jgi:hypothetical protein
MCFFEGGICTQVRIEFLTKEFIFINQEEVFKVYTTTQMKTVQKNISLLSWHYMTQRACSGQPKGKTHSY